MLTHWLHRHRWQFVVLIIILSVLVRLVYFVEIANGPCAVQHRWDQSDMNFFDRWAKDINSGDWLSDKAIHPQHGWHKQIAQAYFLQNPEELIAIEQLGSPDGEPIDASYVLWNSWYGGKRFHQEPLYTYLIAITYKIFGTNVQWVYAWQMLLGVASNVLIYLIARRYFGTLVGTIAGLLAVLYGPLLFYEAVLLRTTLINFVGLAAVYLTGVALERGTWRAWLAVGVVFGFALLLKTTFFLLLLGTLLVLVLHYYRRIQNLWSYMVAVLFGVAIVLMPVMIRNVAVGVSPLAMSSVGAITFISSNAEDFQPEYGFYVSRDTLPIMNETDGHFFATVIATLKTHSGVGSYLTQLGRKFILMWHWYEFPNNTNYYFNKLCASILSYGQLTFWLLGPLAFVGLVLGFRYVDSAAPLYLLVLTHMMSLLIFYVLSRFRTPLAGALLPFAALTISMVAEWIWRRRGSWISLIVVFIILVPWNIWTWSLNHPLVRTDDYRAAHQYFFQSRIDDAMQRKDWPTARYLLHEWLSFEPETVQRLNGNHSAVGKTKELAYLFATEHLRLSKVLMELGKKTAADKEWQRAKELMAVANSHS